MHALCVLVAGALQATLPADEFTLAWQHSVQKTQWQETYRVEDRRLVLVEARIQGSGAGMEPGPDARFAHGWWIWQPHASVDSLDLARSPYAPDYRLCVDGRCAALGDWAPSRESDGVVTLRAC